jgi:hypothetical protein
LRAHPNVTAVINEPKSPVTAGMGQKKLKEISKEESPDTQEQQTQDLWTINVRAGFGVFF